MDPFKIQIEVSLSEATIEGLRQLLVTAAVPALLRASSSEDLHSLTEAIKSATREVSPEQSPTPATKVAETAQNPPKQEAEVPAPEPIMDITLFEAVKAAQKERKVPAPTVRKIFAEFGIETSSQCPQERRAELLARINALNAS